ncbi:hypothetical protein E4L95_05335 [Paracoccus liaowanqingii]|uniref:Uncharacterized protein n=1 Tax=Paracoccus liaowanqingii TaxID=2560053 RepID=A0A4Z1CQE6_9RHOB|nr:hypothetical protein [Paracoccus liaowanqingii]TGN67328.1 hypothetical protein E4L95_05335 [Paracoccus liaowanqingii]
MTMQQTAPYIRKRILDSGTVKWDFVYKAGRMKQALRIALPDNAIEPWYSPAYMTALTRTTLRPGKVREVLQSLPFSLARCIGQFKTSGELAKRSPAAQMLFDRSAEMLFNKFGWVDVRELTPGGAAFLTSASDRPQDVGAVLSTVLAHAARQGIGTWTGRRRVLPAQPRSGDGRSVDHRTAPQRSHQKVIAMPTRSQKPRPASRVQMPQRAVQFAEVVQHGAHHGWPELTVPQIMAAGFRMGITLPSERVVRRSLNTAVEMGLIARTGRGSYGAVQRHSA